MQKLLEKIPPHDLETERALLACLIYNNANIQKALNQISGEDFYNTSNQQLFEKIVDLSKKSIVDSVVLSTSLVKNKTLLTYLIDLDLDDCVPHDLGFQTYVNQIKNYSLRRKQTELAIKVFNDAHNDNIESAENIEELKKLLENANLKDDTSIMLASDFDDQVENLFKFGLQSGLSTGWQMLDKYYSVKPGQITLVTGVPSHGKSTYTTNLITNIAKRYSWKFAVFTPENQPMERYIAHIMQIYLNKPFGIHKQNVMTEGERIYAKEWINNHFVFITPKDDELRFQNILNKALICCVQHGIKGLVLDPWNEIDHTRPQGLTETEYISKCLSKLRYFARNYQVHVWLVAHPTKLMKNKDGSYPIPTPYDISGSSHWRNKADCCLCIWRNTATEAEDSSSIDVHIQKIRFHEVGKIGKVTLHYNFDTQSYYEL